MPALHSWDFGTREAGRIRSPVLYVHGSVSGPLFAGVRDHVLRLLPHAEEATVHGAGHSVASTHAGQTARLLVDFLRRRSRS